MSHDLLSAGDASPAARAWLAAVKKKKPALAGGAAPPAQPFLAAWLARETKRTICVVCPDVKRQEEFFHDLLFWQPAARLLPDLELAVEGVGVLRAELGLDAPDGHVHAGHAPGGRVALLPVDRSVITLAPVRLDELLALNEHSP